MTMRDGLGALSGATTEALAEALRNAISDGRLPPGEPLRQLNLASRFGTSRIPIREALRTLQAEGLVTYEPNRGAIVSIASPAEILEMLEVRIALECYAIALAIPQMAESGIAAMRSILEAYDSAPSAE